ncbi:pilus assembly protein [Sphingomonas sp.]|uniref:TadE/TadG family type IV pilus assembly protein n=1 Tax=Sphingomonas sp. TaxID=28214 RepID=UPI00286D0124|nr:pilus assembly protein [Sphingomonas sp.]
MKHRHVLRNESGAAALEMAFALPVMIVMIWAFVQLAQVYRAMAGIQQGLGQGARYATLCLNPTTSGCTTPTATQVKTLITNSVYGIGPGTFAVVDPVSGTSGTAKYYDLKVTYTQPTDLLLFPGPTISVSRAKRVWVAGA